LKGWKNPHPAFGHPLPQAVEGKQSRKIKKRKNMSNETTQNDSLISVIEIKEILKILPHRHPFLMVDRVTHLELGKSITGHKNITANEPCFTGHFPNNPVFPGVLMLEALAQAAGILFFRTNEAANQAGPDKKYLYLFAGIDKARFKRMVIPGDQLVLKAKLIRSRKDFGIFQVEASVLGELACSAEILSAVREISHDK
jgi:3-hydroxyacyl-[acyl-carrier-protein] dehydratase